MPRLNNPATVGGNLDVAVSSRASASDMALVLARLPSVGFSSVQYGTLAIAAAGVSGTATIISVDTTKSIVIPLGVTDDSGAATGAGYDSSEVGLVLTNATTVTGTRNGVTGNLVVYFAVVYFATATRVQVGTVTCNAAVTGTATILAVNQTKTLLFDQGEPVVPQVSPDRGKMGLTLTNSTTVTGTKFTATGIATKDFAVVEMP